ncbi:hypothetical protein BJ170DRAFT_619941 [Xylariales sp. AK1849]|nr:hypothetical protein BJ170DRAFT_619941 [Xylariales sp. AK1849]
MLVAILAPKFPREGYTPSVIVTTGQVAEKPLPGYSILSAFAAAIHGLVRNLVLDRASLRFNVVAPGPTETELWGEQRDALRKIFEEQALLGKAGDPDDIAVA